MIYLVIYIYLITLIVFYDFRHKTSRRQVNMIFALLCLILISGFRYRIGSDTVVYMDDFNSYPKLSELTFYDLSNFRYQPLWIILNSLGRSLGDFMYVQLITSAIHISIIGYIINKICPSLFFSSLLYYYLFDYYNFNMDVMREALSISFILLALLSLEKREYITIIIYVTIATLFHIFALPIFIIFILYYKFLLNKPIIGITIICILAVWGWINKDFMSNSILRVLSGGSSNSALLGRTLMYANDETYGVHNVSIINTISFFLKGTFYVWGLYKLKPIYQQYVHFDWKIFSTTCWLSSILTFCFYSMPILHRPYQYFSIFQTLLFFLLFIYIAKKFIKPHRACIYMTMLCLVTLLGVKKYMNGTRAPDVQLYSRFYPYSSVFDKTIYEDRERSYIK